jgi:hypothetical protein
MPRLVIISSELLRPKQGVNQVHKQAQRCDTGNDVVHEVLLELVAGLGEDPEKKQCYTTCGDIEKIEHVLTPFQ